MKSPSASSVLLNSVPAPAGLGSMVMLHASILAGVHFRPARRTGPNTRSFEVFCSTSSRQCPAVPFDDYSALAVVLRWCEPDNWAGFLSFTRQPFRNWATAL